MSVVDGLVVALALALGLLGVAAGLVTGALTMLAFAAGAVLGAKLGPLVLSEGSASPYAPLTALATALVLGTGAAAAVDGLTRRLRARVVRGGHGRALDAIGGGLLFVGLGLAVAWFLGVVALNTPGLSGVREDVQRSAILSRAYELVPPQGELVGFLNRIDPSPPVAGPAGPSGRPPSGIASDPEVRRAGRSVVRVLGTACGLGLAGSGWVAGEGLVVTNAHVIAGQEQTRVETRDGASFDAVAVAYEPKNDLAILRADGISAPPLALGSPVPDTGGAVLGYPENGPLSISPARLGRSARVRSNDSYGNGPVIRRMTPFRAEVRSGNSGGPLVGVGGEVLTTVFAASVDTKRPQGLGVPNAIVARALENASEPVDTGPCAA